MRFVIVYELGHREYDNMFLLSRELIRRGHKVKLYHRTQEIQIIHKDSVLILPNAYRNSHINEYRYNFNTRNDPIIVYPVEQLNNGILPDYFDFSLKNMALHLPTLCWGPEYKSFIDNLGYDNKFNCITGAIQLDFCREEFRSLMMSREKISNIYGLPISKKWFLFTSDFIYVDDAMVRMIVESGQLKKNEALSRQNFECSVQKVILEWFDRFLSSRNDYILIYRKHPVEKIQKCVYDLIEKHPGNVFEIADLNIKQWFCVCDIVSCFYSTSSVECAVYGKSTLLLRPVDFNPDAKMKDYSFFSGYPKINNYDEFCDAIEKYDRGEYKIILDNISKQFSIEDIPAYYRVADAIEHIAMNQVRKKLEKGFYLNRYKYLIKNHVFFKLICKYFFRKIYVLCPRFFYKSVSLGMKDWIQLAINKRNQKQYGEKIDRVILEIANSKGVKDISCK